MQDLVDKINNLTPEEFMEQIQEIPWINKPKINKNSITS